MSRDWTPRELYGVDNYYRHNGKDSLRDIDWKIVYNGEEFPIKTEEEKQYGLRHSELDFLFHNLYDIYKKFPNNEKEVDEVLDDVEKSVVAVENDSTYNAKYVPFETVKKWFDGELDDAFYYSNYNHSLLKDEICKQIESIIPEEPNEDVYEGYNPIEETKKKKIAKGSMSYFCPPGTKKKEDNITVNTDAGDVEKGIEFFNNASGTDGDVGTGEAVGEQLSVADALDKLKDIN